MGERFLQRLVAAENNTATRPKLAAFSVQAIPLGQGAVFRVPRSASFGKRCFVEFPAIRAFALALPLALAAHCSASENPDERTSP